MTTVDHQDTSSSAAAHAGVDPHHGNNPASWTLTWVVMLGVLIMCVAAIVGSTAGFVGGVLVCMAGAILGYVLARRGYGRQL